MGKTKTAKVDTTEKKSKKGKSAEPEVKEEKTKKVAKVKERGKKYTEAKLKIDRNKQYLLPEAISLVKAASYSKFDGTMEAHLTVKKEGLTAQVTLPFSGGKAKKIEVASDETVKKLQAGKVDFDVLLATADMMPKLVAFARILGPKGMMPNPKNGTLIKSKEDAKKFSGNTFTLKTEKAAPLIHTSFGKVSQKENELEENLEAILKAVGKKQIVKGFIKATMSPSVKISL
ncbi:MAG TPA: hypothetical protein VF185_00805 [Patescibacteria group bacterium]